MKTQTPETDVAEYYIQGEGNYVRADVSRKLERERDEARVCFIAAMELAERYKAERDEAREERDRYKRMWDESRMETEEAAK